ncbi:MAG TPA: sulfotransferase family 2 domain-containing protein [Gammaproteobacteria bacterium]|nr:sulfotransferase family 2 domain-containing protein [Gammaproteobacteria bacterium]
MINHRYKFIFVHINKCAGQSVQRALPRGTRGHNTIFHYLTLCECEGRDPSEYFKFTIVRNPWDKIVSFYHYHKGRRWDLFPWTAATEPDFNAFVWKLFVDAHGALAEEIFRGRGGESSHHVRLSNSLDWVSRPGGAVLVDYVGRMECLQADFLEVCDRIGIRRRNLPHVNRSSHKPYWEYYNDDSIEVVASRFQRDIDYFGYRFGV